MTMKTSVQLKLFDTYYFCVYLIDLTLLSRHSFDCFLCHVFFLLFSVLFTNISKWIVCFIVTRIHVIPGTVKSLLKCKDNYSNSQQI